MNAYLSTLPKMKQFFYEDYQKIDLKVYELKDGTPTGYKVYVEEEQVATLEFRDDEWIVGILVGFRIEVRIFADFYSAYCWIKECLAL